MKKIYIDELDNVRKKLLSNSRFSRVFIANNKVYKTFYRENIKEYYSARISEELTGDLIKKRELNVVNAYNLNFSELVNPIELIYDDEGFLGYSMEYLKHSDFYDLLYSNLDNSNYLKLVCDQFYKIEKMVKKGHKHNIVFPDLFSKGNLVIDEDENHRIIDLDALQINNNFLWEVSGIVGNMETGILKTTRFRTDTEFKKEFDHFSILNSFILCSTYINVATIAQEHDINLLLEILWITGLDKEQRIVEELLNAYNVDGKNSYLGETYKKLAMNYRLEENLDYPNSKRFVKKR